MPSFWTTGNRGPTIRAIPGSIEGQQVDPIVILRPVLVQSENKELLPGTSTRKSCH